MNESTGSTVTRPEFLDCTFRDGGYYNNWDFDKRVSSTYLDSVAKLPISILEMGYLNAPKPGYFGKYFFLSVPVLAEIKGRLAPAQRLAVMINAKDHRSTDVAAILQKMEGIVDIVRIAVAPTNLSHGLALAERIQALGFEVGVNVMYLSRFADNVGALVELPDISKVARTVSLVDSYGACEPDQVRSAVQQARAIIPGGNIGFHGHDNLGLAFANSLAAIEAGALVIDSTMAGMGRGAGNTRTEMLLVREAARTEAALNFDALTSVVDVFDDLKEKYRWGTNLPYMISGASDLPQKDVMDWVGKNRYSVVSILRALHGDRAGGVDTRRFEPLCPPEDGTVAEVLIVGGGPSVVEHIDGIEDYLRLSEATVIHANFRHLDILDRFGGGQLVCLAGDGVTRLPPPAMRKAVSVLVAPEPPRLSGAVPEDETSAVVQVAPFTSNGTPALFRPVSDTGPLALGLGAALALGAKRISLVGFDGYHNASAAQQGLARETQEMLDTFCVAHPDLVISSLTPSTYQLPATSLYSRIVEMSRQDDRA